MRAAGWSSEQLVRCVRVDRAAGGRQRRRRRGSARALAGDRTGRRPARLIVHDSYPTVASYFESSTRYTRIEAEAIAAVAAALRRRGRQIPAPLRVVDAALRRLARRLARRFVAW